MANEGIMAAPMPMQQQQQQPLQGYVSSLDAYNAASSAMQETNPQAFGEYKAAIGSKLSELNLKSSEIESFVTLLEYMLQYPDQYKEVIRAGIEAGAIEEGDFPPEFDQSFVSTMLAALNEQRIQQVQNVSPEAMGPGPQEPMAMKSGGLADAAKALQARGRGRDTILAHINPQEAEMLRRAGGLGTINPYTGLREYGWLNDAWNGVKGVAKGVGDAVKSVASSPIGRIALSIGLTMYLGPLAAGYGIGTAGTAALVGGGLSALSGGSLQDVLKGAAMGYIGGTIAPSISGYMPGAAGSVLNQGFTGAALGTGFGLASGMSLQDSLKAGAIGGVTAAGVGYGQQKGYIPGGKPVDLGYSPAEQARLEQMGPISLDDNLSINPVNPVGDATSNLPPSTVDKYSPYYKAPVDNLPSSTVDKYSPYYKEPVDNFMVSQAQANAVMEQPGYTPRLSTQSQYLMNTPPTDYSLGTAPLGATNSFLSAETTPVVAPTSTATIQGVNASQPRIENINGRPNYVTFDSNGAPVYKPVPFNERVYSDSGTVSVKPSPPVSYDQPGRFGTDSGVQTSPAPSAMNDASAQFGTSAGGSGQQTANTYYTAGSGQSQDAISMRDAMPPYEMQIAGPRYGDPAPVEDRSSYSLGARGEQVYGSVKDLYNENFATDRPSIQAGNAQAEVAGGKAVAAYRARMEAAGIKPTATGAEAAYDAAYEANAPGFISKYLPLAAAGLGATYLAGGFKEPPADDKPVYDPAYTGTEYIRDNPQAFSGSLYNYQSQGAGAYDPSRVTTYEGGQGAAAPGVVTPTGIMQAQYSPEYGRRRTQALQQYYYSPFIGTAAPIMAAKGGMVTAEPVYMGFGGDVVRAIRGIKEPAAPASSSGGGFGFFKDLAPTITQAVAQRQAQQQQAQQLAQQQQAQQAQQLAQQLAQERARPQYNPYRETSYAGSQSTASPGVVAPTGIMQAQYSPNYGRRRMRPVRAADGGSITEFPRKSGPINGRGTGTSDDIPAMLSDGEFVFTARAVRNAGNGSRRKGAARMYKLMKSLEKGGMVKG